MMAWRSRVQQLRIFLREAFSTPVAASNAVIPKIPITLIDAPVGRLALSPVAVEKLLWVGYSG
jgi:hypothetical protein